MQLKEKLLSLGIFEDNEYLDFYLQKIEENKDTVYIKGKFERHHIVPRIYFKYNNLKIDNSKDNIVILNHFDHCLVHYYLCLCLVGELRYKNEHAFLKMVNIKTRFEFNYDDFMSQASKYNDIYKKFVHEQSERAKERFKNGGTIKGKHYYTNGKELICRNSCPEGYWPSSTRAGKSISEESRQRYREAAAKRTTNEYRCKISESKQKYYINHEGATAHRKWVTNGVDEKLVDLNIYILEDGWYIGRSESIKLKNILNAEKGRKIYYENKKPNKRMFEYWLDEDEVGKIIPIKMPYKYLIESFCDMVGASKAYNSDNWTPQLVWNYWNGRCKGKRIMNSESEYLVEKLIWNLYILGEEEFFEWYRSNKNFIRDCYENNLRIEIDI